MITLSQIRELYTANKKEDSIPLEEFIFEVTRMESLRLAAIEAKNIDWIGMGGEVGKDVGRVLVANILGIGGNP